MCDKEIEIAVLKEKISRLEKEMSINTLTLEDHTKLIWGLEELHLDVETLSSKYACIKKDIDGIQERYRYRHSIIEVISNQWWKILIILVPVFGFFFEIGVYLRNLPV